MFVTKDATDITTYFHLRLTADGTDATGLTVTNFDLQYVRSGATAAAKVDASALGAANSAHADNSAIEVDVTDQPGLYRVDWPDAAFATGVDWVYLTVKCATAFTETLRVQLISATRGLAGTALPNAAADAAGGLPISDAGGLDLDAKIGALTYGTANRVNAQVYGMEAATVTAAAIATGAIDADALAADAITDAKVASDVTIASVTGAVGSVTGAVGSVTGAVGSIGAGGITAASFGANAITAAKLDPDVTTELQAGLATAAALAVVDGIVDDILLDTAEIGTAGAGLTNINLPNQTMDIAGNITGNLSGSVGSVTGAVGSVTGAVGSVTGNVGGNVTGSVGSLATQAKADVNAEADTALADVGVTTTVTGRIDAAISTRAAAALFTGITSVAQWLGLITGKQTGNSTALTEVNATGAGSGTYQPTTDSLEAVRDRGDVAWTTATGFSTLSQADVRTAVGLASANLDTQLDALPTAAENATAVAAAVTSDHGAGSYIRNTEPLDAAGTRSAVGLASANLDTQLDALPTAAENADKYLGRNLAGGSDGGRTVQDALRFNRNRFEISGGVLTVFAEDDVTPAWTAVITQTAGNPVSASDPA